MCSRGPFLSFLPVSQMSLWIQQTLTDNGKIIFMAPDKGIYFIVSGEISVYLMKIKVVAITSELISYHFTSD